MASILDYSNEPRFNINVVSKMTEIQTVTIRAWERRYSLLTPHRAQNGYRLFSERDVAVLRWVKQKVDQGFSISSVTTEWKSLVAHDQWPEAVITDKSPVSMWQVHNFDHAESITRLTRSLVRHDERMAAEIFEDVLSSLSLNELFESILIPVLVEIGILWERGEIRVATEHFASGFLRSKVMTIYQGLPLHPAAPKIIVGCGPDELHEIGPMMLSTLLRNRGYRVEYLGPDIPLEDLLLYIRDESPRMVVLSATLRESAKYLAKFPEKLRGVKHSILFGFGGSAFNSDPDLVKSINGVYLGRSISNSVLTIGQIVPLRSTK